MKNIFLFTSALMLSSLSIQAQDVAILFGDHYHQTDQTFGGNYTAYQNANDVPYIVDDNGLITGKHLTFYDNGSLETKGTYLKGIKNGLWMSWDENGLTRTQAYYTNGMKDGNWKVWDENGTLRYTMHYKNGNRVKTWQVFDDKGAMIEEKQY